jgi:CheY-like chemotaxis protein
LGRLAHHERLSGRRILIVEDEVLIAFDLRECLRHAGARSVALAHTLADALPLARKAPLSAAVLDIRLGSDCVAPVAEALAERGIPFLFYSGQASDDPVQAAFPDVLVLNKPTDPEAIVRALGRLPNDATIERQ